MLKPERFEHAFILVEIDREIIFMTLDIIKIFIFRNSE